MPPLHKTSIRSGAVNALNAQTPSSIYPYGFPFTLNPTMGCSFGCKFCYSPLTYRKNFAKSGRDHFFNESTIKIDLAESLNKDLERLKSLPQHLKRVQINETSDYYLSEVLTELDNQNRDLMMKILEVFQNHWINGNKWMLHILTKSHLIERHINKLKVMRDMIQVEMSFSTPYESQLRDLELFTPTIKKRLETIEKLSKEDIFVRVMAMPFYGGVTELDELKRITFNAGAQALKNKALNYFQWNDVKNISFDDLVQYKLPQTGSRTDTIISQAHMIKSGEEYLVNGQAETIDIVMPSDKAWASMSKFQERSSVQPLAKVEMGYDELNDVNWGYIKSKMNNLQSSIRTNIMSNSNLSTAQKFYSSYYPEMLKESPDKEIYDFNSPFILNDTGKNLTIEKGGLFTCKRTQNTGFPAQFYQLVEGIPEPFVMDYFKLISAGGILPDLQTIQNHSQNLFDPTNSPVLDYLKNNRGLTDSTIKDYQIGYDGQKQMLIFPILNATQAGIVAMKYVEFPINKTSKKDVVIGCSILLDYSRISKNIKNITRFLFVNDILDAIYLRQVGYDVLYNIEEETKWHPEWNKLIKGKEILIITDDVEESIRWAIQFKGKASKLTQVALNNSVSSFFVRSKKSTQDFEEIVKTSKTIDANFVNNYELIKTAKSSVSKKNELNLAQDYINDKMYFGIYINEELSVITSNYGRIELEDLEKENLETKYEDIDESLFSLEGVENYLIKNYKVNPFDLFNKIRDYLKKYVFIDNQNVYDLLSIWIIGTYVFRIFRHYPYVHIQAEKGSGKSHLFEIIKPLCFNGAMYVTLTTATLFRDVDRNSRTLLLDEIEDFKKYNKPGFNDLMSILNSGYAKSGDVARSRSGKKGGIEKYKTYSPKMFAGINDINATLDSRTIKIQMKRKLEEEKLERYIDNQSLQTFHQTLRNDLYNFALHYAPEINSRYPVTDSANTYLKNFDSRRYDIWAPMFIIADVIESTANMQSKSISDSLLAYSKTEYKYHQVLDAESSELIKLIEALNTTLKSVRYKKLKELDGENILYYLTNDVYNYTTSLPDYRKRSISISKFSRELNKLGIEVKNTTGNEKCYEVKLNELADFAKRYNVEFSTEGIVRTKSSASTKFIPNRLLITENAKDQPLTNQIINTVKQLNPKVEIEKVSSERPTYPDSLGISERYKYLSETLLLGTRSESSPFTACFESPGNIVEGMTVTTNLQFHCSSNCEFCYLHGTQTGEPRWRKIYTNLDRWEEEIKKERLVFDFANSLWSAISFYKKETLPKIPEGFKDVVDDFRKEILRPRSSINELEDVKRELEKRLADIIGRMGLQFDYPRVNEIKKDLRSYFSENAKLKLKLNVGEYTDIVRTNHLTGHLDFLMQRIQREQDFNITMYIKSADIDDLVKYNGHNRVQVTLGFNTDHAITTWEKDTSSLDERMDAFNKIQKAKGFIIRPSIEPVIAYNGFIKEYQELAKRMKKELNLEAKNVSKIRFGCLRIGPLLKQDLLNYFPETTLFSETEEMFQPVKPDNKMRYREDLRIEVYKVLLEEFAAYRSKLALACEYPSIWDKLGMSYKEHLKDYVYQYQG
ncbi:MAG: hypothetical protein DAHOPDDO_02131 [Ignavibacteriaceae bacterium]|jgi:DNA repair photolyase|nr:hypothetical protein [Ignavibacteriaceae bacterium]MCO6446863.1 DUF3631 domain-containing protein [Ignavibacterium album]MDT3696718.1 DUF3631 domain-containing protein [Ignavibacterium sp.]HOJ07292.1 DUF3631 domain-containing protein [Ignavibacteriaceae bacterium]